MRYGGGFRFLAALLLLGVIGLLTAGAYGAGYTAGSGSGTAASAWAYGGAFGAGHVIGFFVTILVLIIVFRLIMIAIFGGHRRAWARHGYWHGEGDADQFGPGFGHGHPGHGPGGWHRSEWREAGQAAFDDFHRRSHGTEPPFGGQATGGPSAGSPATGWTSATAPNDQPR
jgi:hypothetical protein